MAYIFVIPDFVRQVMDKLKAAGFEAFVVGGCVRDSLLGHKPSDYDVTTAALPADIKTIFQGYRIVNNNGEKHGTITVMMEKNLVEITTYRPSKLKRRPTIEDDLSSRDFTINAIAYNDDRGFVGQEFIQDIDRKLIRAVGDPYDRLDEDGLRILRALRFASTLGFDIEENTSIALFQCKDLLKIIAKERIQEELNKILLGKNCYEVLKKYRSIFSVFIPKLEECFDFDQKNKYHRHDLYEHTLQVVRGVEPILELKLAALLHDIAKPESVIKDTDENGNEYYHYYGHPIKSAAITSDVLKALKYPNQTIELVTFLVKYHDYSFTEEKRNVKKLLNHIDKELPSFDEKTVFEMVLNLRQADRSDHDYSTIDEPLSNLNVVRTILEEVLREKDCFSVKNLAINGTDLMNLGWKGKAIGGALKVLVQKVIDEELENDRDVLLQAVKKLKG